MEEVKVSELPVATDVNDEDLVMVVQDGFNKQVTKENFQKDKVNKSGDTLTGGLLFKNKDEYDAIRKTRTIDGVDYELSVGLGANKSARLELSTGGQTLAYVEARTDGGIYNGKTDKKLAEQESSVVNITARVGTLGANTSYKIGNVVGLNARFDGVTVSAGSTTVLCTLPSGYYNTTTQMQVVIWANNLLVHCWIRTNGEVAIVPPSNLNNAEVRMVGSFIV